MALKLYELWLLAGAAGGGLDFRLDELPDNEAGFSIGDGGGSSARPPGRREFGVIFCAATLAGAILFLIPNRCCRRQLDLLFG